MEQQDDGSQTANSSTDGSGGTTTFSDTGADGYQSFWDIAERREMFYHYKIIPVITATQPCYILK